MRAIYSSIEPKDNYLQIEGEPHHHLSKVVRVQVGEEILIINGQGKAYVGWIDQLERKFTKIMIKEEQFKPRKYNIDIFLCLVKKEALESSVRLAAELGLGSVHLLETEFSQRYKPNYDRLKSIVTSGLEQSNCFYLTEVNKTKKLAELVSITEKYEQIFYFSSVSGESSSDLKLSVDKSYAYIIGPEGGLSPKEEELIKGIDKVTVYQLTTPILRTPTAVSAAMGYLLAHS